MMLRAVCLSACLILAVVQCQVLDFARQLTSDGIYGGNIRCVAKSLLKIVNMAIYDTTEKANPLKLASISVFAPEVIVDPPKSNVINATGTISKYDGVLNVSFLHDVDCLYGALQCQLDFYNSNDQPDVIRENLTSATEENATIVYNLAQIAEQLKKLSEDTDKQLGALKKDNKVLKEDIGILKQDNEILKEDIGTLKQDNEVLKEDIGILKQDNKVLKEDIEILKQDNEVFKEDIGILKQDNAILKEDIGIMKQDNEVLTENIGKLKKDIDVLNEDIGILKHDEVLKKEIGALKQDNEVLKADTGILKQDNEALKTVLDGILMKVSRIDGILNSTLDKDQHNKSLCYRGMPHKSPREKFLLQGKIEALCDTETDGGGWVIIQRRVQGDVDFYRGWDDYKKGFGTADTDFWIGNYIIHNLTSQGYNELWIDFIHNETKFFAQYTNFILADESSKYAITIDGYSGNVFDTMNCRNGSKFGTFDRYNYMDFYDYGEEFHGAWWYNDCDKSNLNGAWADADNTGIVWYQRKNVSFTEMKIRNIYR